MRIPIPDTRRAIRFVNAVPGLTPTAEARVDSDLDEMVVRWDFEWFATLDR